MSEGLDFQTLYQTDLVYVPGCWQLCGNAHCCNFTRQKSRFKLLGGQKSVQELPLLPGEYGFLQQNGYLQQFQDHDLRELEHEFGSRRLKVQSILSRKPGGCACEHSIRPVVCRLYPVLPLFDLDGNLTGIDRLGIYDTLEILDQEPHICQISSIPFGEMSKLLKVTSILARHPESLFCLMAYKITQDHVKARLTELRGTREVSHFSVFEMALLRQRLLDHDVLNSQLSALADAIEARCGRPLVLS